MARSQLAGLDTCPCQGAQRLPGVMSDENLDQYVPPAGWRAWGAKRQTVKRGPLYGLDALVRAGRHEGVAVVRCVAPGRSVIAWRPSNPLLQTTIARGLRPRVVLWDSITIPTSTATGNELVITGPITMEGDDMVIPQAHIMFWIAEPRETGE